MCGTSDQGSSSFRLAALAVMHCSAWAALLFSGNALGAVHYYYGDISVPLGYDQPVDLNFENDDFDDVIFENFIYAEGNYQGLYIPYSPGRVVGFNDAGVEYITALSSGATIDSTALASSNYYGALSYGSVYPQAQFTSATDAFIGLAFPANSNLLYAWVRVSVDNAAGTLYIKDWAFEDQPGVGITAGDQGTLPIYGDLNGDRNVDLADLMLWQRGYPSTYNIFDFWKWQDNFGAGSGLPSQAQVTTVPEPSALLLFLILGLPVASRRKR